MFFWKPKEVWKTWKFFEKTSGNPVSTIRISNDLVQGSSNYDPDVLFS